MPSVRMSAVLNHAMLGGNRYVCLYDVEEKVLLRRVQISANRSLDGVLDQLNSKHLTDAGPAALIDDAPDDADPLLPPTTAGASMVPSILSLCINPEVLLDKPGPPAAHLSHGLTASAVACVGALHAVDYLHLVHL